MFNTKIPEYITRSQVWEWLAFRRPYAPSTLAGFAGSMTHVRNKILFTGNRPRLSFVCSPLVCGVSSNQILSVLRVTLLAQSIINRYIVYAHTRAEKMVAVYGLCSLVPRLPTFIGSLGTKLPSLFQATSYEVHFGDIIFTFRVSAAA